MKVKNSNKLYFKATDILMAQGKDDVSTVREIVAETSQPAINSVSASFSKKFLLIGLFPF